MYSRISTVRYTRDCCAEPVERLKEALAGAEAVLVGAGAGFSASAGLVYTGPRFEENFADFIAVYGFADMYSAGFHRYSSLEEHWAYWSRHIYLNRYAQPVGRPYLELLELLRGRDYFVLTTNVDHQFPRAGFEEERLFRTQGDYGLWQCSVPCHDKTYGNEAAVRRMVAEQRDMRVPAELVPYCPRCGAPMCMNLRVDGSFVEDAGWHVAKARYLAFLRRTEGSRLLFLELGVGGNTPGIIKYPFWRMTAANPHALYICVNSGEAFAPKELGERALCIDCDIAPLFAAAVGRAAGEA
ncbi:SIR2 family NAD-dependent protein deacylase [Cloacibacillus porcorum]|uniref:Sir2 silent information regulator family NAD-dependent deacetylase n=1 Tax=Cloacibacillus porcorum TaxID=1197717 RepID=A0A1B2I190_9BACT|nr:Sir2 silent information regulator family NAD-dependent deacetylase [Cloacibacillus porcorum]ANZ43738.1 Sir2 silent information regulator family NAD-dependent deacetylase [Cloacibacillus porcorum]